MKAGRGNWFTCAEPRKGWEQEEEGGEGKKNQKKHWDGGRREHGNNLIQL